MALCPNKFSIRVLNKALRQFCLNRTICTTSANATIQRYEFFPPRSTPMLPPDTFKGKVAFITGGGTGLGKGMASMLAKLGAQVAIASRKLDVLNTTAREIQKETSYKVFPVECDIREPSSIKEAVSDVVHEFGLPTIIINNAAANFASPTERLSKNAWKSIVDVVLNGTAYVTMDIARRLIAAKQGGVFLSISAAYADTGSGFVVPNAAAKAGVKALSMSLASEWGQYGLRFNCIAPGAIETKRLLPEGAFSRIDPENRFKESFAERNPTGRLGEVEELANLACYLVSDYSSWINGTTVKFDGGEYVAMAGQLNALQNIDSEEWLVMEGMIRNASSS